MNHYTVKNIISFDECEAFVRRFCADNTFSDPMLSTDEQVKTNLLKSIEKPENHAVIGVFGNQRLIGLFAFLVIKEEHYLEMLVGLSSEKEAYSRMFAYLRQQFASYNADFVFNPNNCLLRNALEMNGAVFEVEQQKMVWVKAVEDINTDGVELLTEKHIDSYLEMHNTDLYWTGDKVIAAPNTFRIFVATDGDELVGYLDVTHCFDENEPYDLLVKEACRRKGYGRKLLAKALEMNKPKGMMVQVDVDDGAATRLYESLGFEKAENQNSLLAHLKI